MGEQADADKPFNKPGRYYLKLALEDSSEKELYNATGGQPYTSEMQVEILGRGRDEKDPQAQQDPALPAGTITPEEPPSTALLALVGGGLAALGFGAGAVFLWRRRA